MGNTAEVRLSAPHDLRTFTVVGPREDAGVIGEIQRSGGTYEPQVMEALRRLLPPDAIVFDIGAHIGVFALALSRMVPQGRVFAFEPAEENYAYLQGNLARNGIGNVVAERSAVWDKAGTVPFVFSAAAPSGSFVSAASSREDAGDSLPVDAVRLDDYVAARHLRRVDLVMIDAEGAEMAVLRGGAQTLTAHRPALLVEVNPVSLPRFGGTSFHALVARLGEDRNLYSIGEGGALARVVSDRHVAGLLRRSGLTDLLALPRRHPGTRLAAAGGLAARARGAREVAALARAARERGVPENNFVAEPSFTLSLTSPPVRALPSQIIEITVRAHNTSRYWFSSDFVYHPVHVSYRWLTAGGAPLEVDAHRGRFDPPLAPGATAEVRLPVMMPPAPGDYQLIVTLVQEGFAWLDHLDPSLRLQVPATAAV